MSIPFSSGNSFLPICVLWALWLNPDVCQSPSHRGTHFYSATVYPSPWGRYIVSIPFSSGNSFLPYSGRASAGSRNMCQSPSHRGTHFYSYEEYVEKTIRQSVNPLLIGELISTSMGAIWSWTRKGCVNPLLIGELISTERRGTYEVWLECVNPLLIGELISTLLNSASKKRNNVSIPFSSGNSFLPRV